LKQDVLTLTDLVMLCFGLETWSNNQKEHLVLLCVMLTYSVCACMLAVWCCEYALLTASETAGAALLQYLSATFDLEIPQGEAEYVVYPTATNPLLAVLQATWLELEVRGTLICGLCKTD
jgi:hypothetical protein